MRRVLWATLSGVVFGGGLVISGMSNPNKVLNFLDISGDWDPSLLLVMAAAVLVTGVGFRLVWQRPHPLAESRFSVPDKQQIDRPLLFGAALFGLGWGIAGYCPGPALTALVIAPSEALIFVLAMLAGSLLFDRRRNKPD